MRRLLILSLVLSLLGTFVAVSAIAQEKTDTSNAMGLYFDLEYNNHWIDFIPWSPVTLYLVFSNATFSELYSYEVGIRFDGGISFSDPQLLCSDVNLQPPSTDFFALSSNCNEPIETTSVMVLATMTVIPGSPSSFWLSGANELEPESAPLVAIAEDQLVETAVFSNAEGVSARIGGEIIVPAEKQTWGSVKSLYR